MKNKYLLVTTIILLIASMVIVAGCTAQKQEPIVLTVSAAASTTDVLKEATDLYMKKYSNVTVTLNFGSSGTLQKQIEQGAPADIFLSAAAKQMDSLQTAGLIIDSTRKNLLNNKVVLVVPSNSTFTITSFKDLTSDKVKKIAIGDPESVPAGTYGKKAFDMIGIYEQVKTKFILGSDVRAVLAYVEAGNVDAGIVYSTDAAITKGVKIAADAPSEINNEIVYPIAVIKSSKNAAEAESYINFLFGNEAKALFNKYGFSVVSQK
jgi:molybdate transport system substrate-binding protein